MVRRKILFLLAISLVFKRPFHTIRCFLVVVVLLQVAVQSTPCYLNFTLLSYYAKGHPIKSNNIFSESDIFEFHIVSLDNKQWFFGASSAEERDEWVQSIEQQILNSLQVCSTFWNLDSNFANKFFFIAQCNESNKTKGQSSSKVDLQTMKMIKNDVPGNVNCVDCDAPSKSHFTFLDNNSLADQLYFQIQILIGLA